MSFTIEDILKKEYCSKNTVDNVEMNNHAIDYSIRNRGIPLLEPTKKERTYCFLGNGSYSINCNLRQNYSRSFSETQDLTTLVHFQNSMDFRYIHFQRNNSQENQGKCNFLNQSIFYSNFSANL